MLKTSLGLFLLLFSFTAQAADFDIYQSDYKPLQLALLMDVEAEDKAAGNELYLIVKSDLESSRSFGTLDPLSFLATAAAVQTKVEYADWRIIGAEILALCRLSKSGEGWKAQIQVHDPYRDKLLSITQLNSPSTSLRPLAHLIANYVYETVTGIVGHFNSQILYVRKHGDLADLIYMDQDGANQQAVGRDFTLLLSPDWSPDGHNVALNTYVGNRPRLEIFDLSTGKRTVFGKFKGLNSTPEFSPDGRFIAATLSHTGNIELHIYDITKRRWRQATYHPAIDTTPTWSPDSKWLAFTSSRGGTPQIYRLRLADGQLKKVSLAGAYNTSPAWSPRGDRIAFITLKGWEYALATVRMDGSDIRYLATGGRIESPSWSPNAQMILFSREVNGIRKIFRIPSWGGDMEAITAANEDASDPAWSP